MVWHASLLAIWIAASEKKRSPASVGERATLADALPPLEDQHRVDLAARLHGARDARDEPLARDAPHEAGVLARRGTHAGEVFEPPVDPRHSVPREPLEVVATGWNAFRSATMRIAATTLCFDRTAPARVSNH